LHKEVRNGRQRQEGQGQGAETEDKQTGAKGKKEAAEATEKNPLIEFSCNASCSTGRIETDELQAIFGIYEGLKPVI